STFRELWKSLKNLCPLVAPLSASNVNYDLSISPFRKLLLTNSLSSSEPTRNRSCTSLDYWKEEVHDTLARYQGRVRGQLPRKWSGNPHWPGVHHTQRHWPFRCFLLRSWLRQGIVS